MMLSCKSRFLRGCKERAKKKRMVTRVGFEPTQITLLAPEASALDRSAILPDDMNSPKNIQFMSCKIMESQRCEHLDAGRRSGEVRGKNRHFAKLGKAGSGLL
jgi:hypothetical protein